MFSNEAFAQNAEKYMDTVFRVAYGWLKNPDDANDVTQDVLIELYKTDKAFESDAHLKNWLIRVTVNRCKMLFRSPWRRHEDIDDYAETLSFEQPRDGELFEAVMALERKYRVPLLLFYYARILDGGDRLDALHRGEDRQHKTLPRKGEA